MLAVRLLCRSLSSFQSPSHLLPFPATLFLFLSALPACAMGVCFCFSAQSALINLSPDIMAAASDFICAQIVSLCVFNIAVVVLVFTPFSPQHLDSAARLVRRNPFFPNPHYSLDEERIVWDGRDGAWRALGRRILPWGN